MILLIKNKIEAQNPAIVIVCTQTAIPKQFNLQSILSHELKGYELKKNSRKSKTVREISETNSNSNNIITTVYYNEERLTELRFSVTKSITKYNNSNKLDRILLKLSINKRVNRSNTNICSFIIYNYSNNVANTNILIDLEQCVFKMPVYFL